MQLIKFKILKTFVKKPKHTISSPYPVLEPSLSLSTLKNMAPCKPVNSITNIQQLSVPDVFKQHFQSDEFKTGDGDAFFVCDLGEICRQYRRWMENLPQVEPFFAVKCNSEPTVLQLLASLGIGFDCATKGEIEKVLDMGVDPSRVVYTHPCKQDSYLDYAREKNVDLIVFDNIHELHKIKSRYPQAQCILRILVNDSNARVRLGYKFGASMDKVHSLLKEAKDLDLNVVGVSFHVGCCCMKTTAYREALVRARYVFDLAKAEFGFDFNLLDIGGGFLSGGEGGDVQGCLFEEVAETIRIVLSVLFEPNVRVIAEPGRYFVNSSMTLAAQVIGRRDIKDTIPSQEIEYRDVDESKRKSHGVGIDEDEPEYMYYINDGIYGSFATSWFLTRDCTPRLLLKSGKFMYRKHRQDHKQTTYFGKDPEPSHKKAWLWGPTCVQTDRLATSIYCPILESGDWVYFEDTGAYSISMATSFHDISQNLILYTTTEEAVTQYLKV